MKPTAKAGLLALAAALLSGCDTERLRALREAERQRAILEFGAPDIWDSHRALREEEQQRAIRNEAGFLAQREAELKQEEELAKGWPQLHPGMTVAELGKTFPLNFPKATRKAIRSNPAYSMTLKGHKLRFRQDVLEAIE